MKNTNWIKEMSWTEFDERRKTCDTVIIPAGAIEVYGPHLPMGSDIIVAQAVCERVAAKVNALIGPFLEVGDSAPLFHFPGTMKVRPETFYAVYRDITESLMHWGFKNYLFLDCHAGNVPMISQLCTELSAAHSELKFAQIEWWRGFVPSHSEGICDYQGWMAHGHASESGTSIMMYLHPEYVNADQLPCTKMNPKFQRYPNVITYEGFCPEFSANGMLGDAAAATREKGKKIVESCVDSIVEYMKNEFHC